MASCPFDPKDSEVVGRSRAIQAITADGRTLDLMLSVNRLADSEDGSRNFAGTLQDVTAQVQSKRALEQQQRIWRHDLLSAAKGTSDIIELMKMLGFEAPAEHADHWRMAQKSAKATYELIRDTREASSSELVLNLNKVSINEIWELLKPTFLAYNVFFDTPPEDATVSIDLPQFAGRALSNLINNAVKYGGTNSKVQVCYKRKGDRHLFVVRDEGPGLTEEQIEKINSGMGIAVRLRSDIPGTGLGLHSVRKILQAHGGRLDIKSQPGKGSLFIASIGGPK
jgi:signal transduction histidine kinase